MRPILFSIGGIELLAAPVFAGLAAIAAAVFVYRNREHAKLTPEAYWDLMLPMAVGTIAGGVLLYLALYGGGLGESLPRLWRTHRVPGGAFYGNLLGALAVAAWVCRRKGLSFRRVGDLIGTAAPLGLAVMRLGCFQHGCCHGRRTAVSWAVTFTDPRSAMKRSYLEDPVHPAQLYEAAACALIFAGLAGWVLPRAKDGRLPAGSALLAFLVSYGGARFILETFRGGDRGILRPGGLTTAQVLVVLFAGAAVLLWSRWRREPG
jgi:phosphatidylglycerol:prolipoprotein diacylglycerol transferase